MERLRRDFPSVEYEIVGISEIDKYAIEAYNALHPNVPNYGDISKIDWAEVPDFDLFTWSFPCTDISIAGDQKGFEEGSGTASSLAWECLKAIRVKRPKYLLMENVAQLVSKKNLALFNKLRGAISSLDYDNYTEILNAKDYGCAQNRPRVFMISVRRDLGLTYHFPRAFTLEKRLRDYLEPVVRKEDNRIGILCSIWDTKAMTIGDITHESLHITDFLCEYLGIKSYGFDDGEPRAYFAGWVANCIYQVNRGKFK